jgi:hypothetical protein
MKTQAILIGLVMASASVSVSIVCALLWLVGVL